MATFPASLRGNAALTFVPNPLYKRDLNNFAPNVGFAYDVHGNAKGLLFAAGTAFWYASDNFAQRHPEHHLLRSEQRSQARM